MTALPGGRGQDILRVGLRQSMPPLSNSRSGSAATFRSTVSGQASGGKNRACELRKPGGAGSGPKRPLRPGQSPKKRIITATASMSCVVGPAIRAIGPPDAPPPGQVWPPPLMR